MNGPIKIGKLYFNTKAKKDGILTSFFSAIFFIIKLGPLLIYVKLPKKIAAIDIALSAGIHVAVFAYSITCERSFILKLFAVILAVSMFRYVGALSSRDEKRPVTQNNNEGVM